MNIDNTRGFATKRRKDMVERGGGKGMNEKIYF